VMGLQNLHVGLGCVGKTCTGMNLGARDGRIGENLMGGWEVL